MKKMILSAAIAVAGMMFGQQITLQHSFSTGEKAFAFAKGNDMFYITQANGNSLKIYNSNFVLIKTANFSLPSGYKLDIWYDSEQYPYAISKHIFNTDDNLEFLVAAKASSATSPAGVHTKLLLVNENGVILKDFTPNTNVSFSGSYNVFHDAVSNTNKIIIENWDNNNDQVYDVFGLPTSVLAAKEIQNVTKLAAFPIPANKILTISNPGNGSNKLEVYDMTGKIVLHKLFGSNDNTVTIEVENLTKGTYFYKIGELSAKFIKN